MKKFIFPGSFDPFTNGHKAIVDQTYQLCDEFIIAVATNMKKSKFLIPIEDRVKLIKEVFKDYNNIKVIDMTGILISDYCQKNNIDYIVRGVRNSIDFEYEKTLAETNRHLTGVETMLVFGICEPLDVDISSSFIRELIHYELPINRYIPENINNYIVKNNLTF